jgi:hypothetical protein
MHSSVRYAPFDQRPLARQRERSTASWATGIKKRRVPLTLTHESKTHFSKLIRIAKGRI